MSATLRCTPKGDANWNGRTTVSQLGASANAVHTIWEACGLKPHLVRRFRLSSDPHVEEKLAAVVGLYLDPPDSAVLLCMDKKSQGQAPGRIQTSAETYGRQAR